MVIESKSLIVELKRTLSDIVSLNQGLLDKIPERPFSKVFGERGKESVYVDVQGLKGRVLHKGRRYRIEIREVTSY